MTEKEEVPIIKNWVGREGLKFIQNSMNIEKETCKTVMGLFPMLADKFKPCQNEKKKLSLQCCKLKEKKSSVHPGMDGQLAC